MSIARRTLADRDVTRSRELAGVSRSRKRRRPSGAPPPLPRNIRASGKFWLIAASIVAVIWMVLVIDEDSGVWMSHRDFTLLQVFSNLRSDGLTEVMQALDAIGSDWTVRILRWSVLIALLVLKRFRHFFVFLGSVFLVGFITNTMSYVIARPRPLGIEILGHWEGFSHPSQPMAFLAVTLLGISYSMVPPGRYRSYAKVATGAAITILGISRLYLAVDWPGDVFVGAIIGVVVPLIAFRTFTPNEIFPVAYGRKSAAHLDIGGVRGDAIKKALEDQLGLKVLEMHLFNPEGSAGSTPLRLRVEGEDVEYLFAKLYAAQHLRADRSYKFGRALLYGRLEDEHAFNTVRRLVQYEDYMLRVMQDVGLPTACPYGFVEITPEREYLVVTEFLDGAVEFTEAEIGDDQIDEALTIVSTMWEAGLAHRDIKPSNLMIRDGRVHLIDVAFAEVRPTPWREAVDLANMMLVLALRSDAPTVYARALLVFSPEEIAESFAATHGVTMPSQLRKMIKEDARSRGSARASRRFRRRRSADLVADFRKLAPKRKPISVQTWSLRRAVLWLWVIVVSMILLGTVGSNLQGAGLL
jgi:tRNA A-37 threonylcarbamoyl transferase component Bud32/membrane-associated phospholipid phosphatase